ncbi:MAG: hypothetical protein KF897_09585 [Opitutaceae bacterium]|nr:hypothetical protein [Opitutaceae bacterium]
MMPSCHRFCRLLVLALAAVAPGAGWAAQAAKVEGAPSVQGVVYRFFDNSTGARTGELRIGSVDLEYRRQGFMRVAWRPLVVLQSVVLTVDGDQAWAGHDSQIVRALLTHGGREDLVLRGVKVRLAGTPARELFAGTARLLPDGVLELHDATLAADGTTEAGTFRLALTGAHAGQLRLVGRAHTPASLSAFRQSEPITQLHP